MSRSKSMFNSYVKVEQPTTVNREGYPAYERPLEEQYLQTLLTNTLGNTFYATKEELLNEADEIHDRMLGVDPEFAAKALIFSRNEGFMRLQPTFGLAKLAGVRSDLFAKVFDRVILIPSDLQDFMTIIKSLRSGEGGRAVKRQVSKWLNDNLSEYWAIKYNGRGRGYSLSDIVRTVHPKPKGEYQSALFAYLRGRDYDTSLLPQIKAYEAFKKFGAEKRAELIAEGRLPHEVVTSIGNLDKQCWQALVLQLPTMALLRSLNTLSRHGILEEYKDYITTRLTDKESLKKAKILPFRFLKAFKEVKEPWVKDILRQAVEITFENLPDMTGKTVIFLDVSGSMAGDYILIGSVFAIALFKKTKGNCVFWLFNTNVKEFNPSLYDSVLTQAEKIRADGGTDTGEPMKQLTEKHISADNIILITDEQQNTGTPFYHYLTLYRKQVNPEVKTFIIDLAPYRSYLTPPSDYLTHYIYGWSDQVLQYISLASQGYSSMVDRVKNMSLD